MNRYDRMWKTDRANARTIRPGWPACLIIGKLSLHATLFASPESSILLDTLSPFSFSQSLSLSLFLSLSFSIYLSIYLSPSLSRPHTGRLRPVEPQTPDRSILVLRAAVLCSKPLHPRFGHPLANYTIGPGLLLVKET